MTLKNIVHCAKGHKPYRLLEIHFAILKLLHAKARKQNGKLH